MNKKPLVSIIVPNYNHGRFLCERIESILGQSFQDFELILLDDASVDNSKDVLLKYKDIPAVSHICINIINTGSPFIQWKKGVSLVRGEYIWIAESDDFSDPLFLEKMLLLMEKNEDAVACFSGSILIDEDGKILFKDKDYWRRDKKKYLGNYSIFDGMSYVRHNLYWKNYIYNASAVLFRHDCLSKVMDSSCFNMRFCGDWLFWVEIISQGKVIEAYEKLNYFRQHQNSTTVKAKTQGQNILEDIEVVRQIEERISDLGHYRKILRRGILYKKIGRMNAPSDIKKKIYLNLKDTLDGDICSYFIERLNKSFSCILPWLLISSRDRMRS